MELGLDQKYLQKHYGVEAFLRALVEWAKKQQNSWFSRIKKFKFNLSIDWKTNQNILILSLFSKINDLLILIIGLIIQKNNLSQLWNDSIE